MISHKHKYIYIHIPKTGGNSVEAALLENIGIPPERCNDEGLTKAERQEYRIWYTHGEIDVQHRKLGQYKKWREREYFTFSFVRNPWDRYVSEYFYVTNTMITARSFGSYSQLLGILSWKML